MTSSWRINFWFSIFFIRKAKSGASNSPRIDTIYKETNKVVCRENKKEGEIVSGTKRICNFNVCTEPVFSSLIRQHSQRHCCCFFLNYTCTLYFVVIKSLILCLSKFPPPSNSPWTHLDKWRWGPRRPCWRPRGWWGRGTRSARGCTSWGTEPAPGLTSGGREARTGDTPMSDTSPERESQPWNF